ncbi:MAG: YeeE/YedE thiosulfate transporter family protein [Bacteroidota bacterium]
MSDTQNKYMNPYLAGVLLGLIIMASFIITGQGTGASGAFKDIIAAGVVKFAPAFAESSAFFGKYAGAEHSPLKAWLVFEIIGVIAGAIISGALAGRLNLKVEHSPKITSKTRIVMAIIGGIFFGIGSQLGRGCTSGAGLSGMAVMSVSGFLVVGVIFGVGYSLAWAFKKYWV